MMQHRKRGVAEVSIILTPSTEAFKPWRCQHWCLTAFENGEPAVKR